MDRSVRCQYVFWLYRITSHVGTHLPCNAGPSRAGAHLQPRHISSPRFLLLHRIPRNLSSKKAILFYMLTASNSLRPPKLPSLPSPTCPKRTRNRTQAQRSCHSKAHSPHPTKSPSGFETDRFESAEEIQISLWIFYGKRQARRLHRSCTATTKTESAILGEFDEMALPGAIS